MAIAVDYSAGRIDPSALLSQGIRIVCRYITGPGLEPKSLTLSEAEDLLGAGISIVCLWETTAERILGGAPAGHADGLAADQNLIALHALPEVTVFFAADFNVQPDQVSTCMDYVRAAAAALGGQYLAGVYGGLRMVAAAADAGFRTIQTVAWSSGWDPRAAARQTGEQRTIGSITVDVDEIINAGDLGAWTVGGTSMTAPLIPASIATKWPFLAPEFPPGSPYTDPTATIWGDAGARAAAELGQQSLDQLATLSTAITGLSDKIDRLLPGGQAT